MDIPAFIKTLIKELANDSLSTTTTLNELDINATDIAMTLAIPKARLSLKSVPGFDKECKEI